MSGESSSGGGRGWYFTKKEIEELSPSRRDGIVLEEENEMRQSWFEFLRKIRTELDLTRHTIATASVYCHRFFTRNSYAKHNMQIIATGCLLLTAKAEPEPNIHLEYGKPVSLEDVTPVSYRLIHQNDAASLERIKEKDVYEKHKENILQAEKLVIEALDADLVVKLPFGDFFEAILDVKIEKKHENLLHVASELLYAGFSTTLCLKYKPNEIVAGAFLLAADRVKTKLEATSPGLEWWEQLRVTDGQLEEIYFDMRKEFRIPGNVDNVDILEGREEPGGAAADNNVDTVEGQDERGDAAADNNVDVVEGQEERGDAAADNNVDVVEGQEERGDDATDNNVNVAEGQDEPGDDADRGNQSPVAVSSSGRKRKASSP